MFGFLSIQFIQTYRLIQSTCFNLFTASFFTRRCLEEEEEQIAQAQLLFSFSAFQNIKNRTLLDARVLRLQEEAWTKEELLAAGGALAAHPLC